MSYFRLDTTAPCMFDGGYPVMGKHSCDAAASQYVARSRGRVWDSQYVYMHA